MLKGLFVGFILTLAALAAVVYLYFSTGRAPVATSAEPMPFERTFARMGLHAYLDRKPHPERQVPTNEQTYLAGAQVYKDHCAVCHGLPGQGEIYQLGERSRVHRTLEIDDFLHRLPVLHPAELIEFRCGGACEVEGGIRMTGMPGFQGRLSETQIWQVSVLLKDADKIPTSVKSALAPETAGAQAGTTPPANAPKLEPAKTAKH